MATLWCSLPPAAAKPLLHQIQPLARQRANYSITVVVSPLIALMHDQGGRPARAGVEAAFLNSTLSGEAHARWKKRLLRGDITLLYAAPSGSRRRASWRQLDSLHQRGQLSLFAIDERIA